MAAPELRETPARRAAARARPDRDLVLSLLHFTMAGSIALVVLRFGRPLWALPVAALELSVGAGALARWRLEPILVHLRAGLYLGAAALLAYAGIGSSFLVLVVAAHAIATWAVRRIPAEGVPMLLDAYSGLRPASGIQERAARKRAGAEVRLLALIGALVPACATWLLLVSVLHDLARS
jgi:hypothetical protein